MDKERAMLAGSLARAAKILVNPRSTDRFVIFELLVLSGKDINT